MLADGKLFVSAASTFTAPQTGPSTGRHPGLGHKLGARQTLHRLNPYGKLSVQFQLLHVAYII